MPEVRLIDANALKDRIDSAFTTYGECTYVKGIIDAQPTIEAEPVRHGRWDYGECTNCKRNLLELCGGEDYELSMHAEFDAVFCPFCGAKMDGGV